MLILASPSRPATRASSPGRFGNASCATSFSVKVNPSAPNTVLAAAKLSTTRCTWLLRSAVDAWKATMFTLRLASALHSFASLHGLFASWMLHSLTVGIVVSSRGCYEHRLDEVVRGAGK